MINQKKSWLINKTKQNQKYTKLYSTISLSRASKSEMLKASCQQLFNKGAFLQNVPCS